MNQKHDPYFSFFQKPMYGLDAHVWSRRGGHTPFQNHGVRETTVQVSWFRPLISFWGVTPLPLLYNEERLGEGVTPRSEIIV